MADPVYKGNTVAEGYGGDFSYVKNLGTFDWNTNMDSSVDARLFYFTLPATSWT